MNNNQAYTRPPLRSHMRARIYRITRQWPILVWLAACMLCAFLHYQSPHPESDMIISGIVDAEAITIGPVETARIKTIHVKAGQQVRKGDILVEMDTALIAHGITADTLDAISIESAFGDTHQDLMQAISDRYDIMADIEGNLALCRQEWERELAELAELKAEQQRREKLHSNRIIDSLTLNELKPTLAALEKAVAIYPQRIDLYEKQLDNARQVRQGIMDWLGMKENESVSDAIARRLDEKTVYPLIAKAKSDAALMAEAYLLVAPKDGTVSEILCGEGEVIPAEIPILRMVNTEPTMIQVSLSENQVAGIKAGEEYTVRSSFRHTETPVTAMVEYVSPAVHQSVVTDTFSGKDVIVRSQKAKLRILSGHSFMGGESVLIRSRAGRFESFLDRVFGSDGHAAPLSGGA